MIPDLHRFATSGLRRFEIPDLHRFVTLGLRRFEIPDLHRFATLGLRRFEIPDLHRITTLGLRRFMILDLHRFNLPENLFHEFHQTRRFEGDRCFLTSPITRYLKFHVYERKLNFQHLVL
jgi:hypothetical protein